MLCQTAFKPALPFAEARGGAAGGGVGKPGFPTPPRDEQGLFLGGRSPPKPSQGPGPGCAGLRPASAMGYKGSPGRAQPSQTLPRVGEWGNPVSPFPCGAGAWGNPVSPHPSPRAYFHVREPTRRAGCRRYPVPGCNSGVWKDGLAGWRARRRRAELARMPRSGSDCAAAASTGGRRPIAARLNPTRL